MNQVASFVTGAARVREELARRGIRSAPKHTDLNLTEVERRHGVHAFQVYLLPDRCRLCREALVTCLLTAAGHMPRELEAALSIEELADELHRVEREAAS